MPSRRRGFTLAEMLVVCAVLAIAAALALPSSQPLAEARADAAAAEVMQALRFARDEALRNGALRMVRCDTSQNTVSVYVPDSSGNVATALNDPLTHMNYAVVLGQAASGAVLSACSFTFSAAPAAALLAFDANGNPVRGTGASTGPGATATQTLSAGTIQLAVAGSTRTIAVDRNGRVTAS